MQIRFKLRMLYVQIMIPTTIVLIRILGIRRTIQLLCAPKHIRNHAEHDNLTQAKNILRALKVGVEHAFWKGNCLSRSIVLHHLLIRKGISSQLCFGVRNKPKFKAHAWVEHKETPLNASSQVHQNYQIIKNLTLLKEANFS